MGITHFCTYLIYIEQLLYGLIKLIRYFLRAKTDRQ